MREMLINYCNKIIELGMYAMFFFTPLVLSSDTSELFELNKMWLVWGLTVIIGTCWFSKMILQKRFSIQRTPLDIPIGLFVLSQLISTLHSLDSHVSFWGYYSRFNGGFLSTLTYTFLYYAIVSNFLYKERGGGRGGPPSSARNEVRTSDGGNVRQDPARIGAKFVRRLLKITLLSGLVVALWGLPSHFGSDPTCLVFRGTFDVSCWTADFHPTIRMFSTLGQPDWLAAYLCILLPITIAFFFNFLFKGKHSSNGKKYQTFSIKYLVSKKYILLATCYLLLAILFYLDLTFTFAKSGFLGFVAAFALFLLGFLWIQRKNLIGLLGYWFIGLLLIVGSISFFIGTPFSQLNKYTWPALSSRLTASPKPQVVPSEKQPVQQVSTAGKASPQNPPTSAAEEFGGTDSGKIRLYVWKGALDIWRANPIFGTGVETFAYAYYQFRPPGHNMTSEWNFLYNKAHNEYLNYLATTGAFGLGSYLLMIGWFLYISLKYLLFTIYQKENAQSSMVNHQWSIITLALLAGYSSILVTNFFGFSVVIVNLFLFIIPALVFLLNDMLPEKAWALPRRSTLHHPQSTTNRQSSMVNGQSSPVSGIQWTGVVVLSCMALYMLFLLFQYWEADKSYALGYNLDHAGDYGKGRQNLKDAIDKRDSEPVFKDELVVADTVLASAFANQKDAKTAGELAKEALETSNQIVTEHPNTLVFWKSRVRLFYTLAQYDNRYMPMAIQAIEQAKTLAPTDASIHYNLGVIYGQAGQYQKALQALEETIALKPDYRDAYYASALMEHQLGVDDKGKIVSKENLNKAIARLNYILQNIAPKDSQSQKQLQIWTQELQPSPSPVVKKGK